MTGSTKIAVFRIAIVALVIGLLAGAVPGYRALKSWRAHRLAVGAERHLFTNPNAALVKAQAAIELTPQNSKCLRVMARVLARLGRDDAFRYWETASRKQPLPELEQQERIDLALKLQRLDLAEQYLAPALRAKPVRVATLRSVAVLYALREEISAATQMARAWLAAEPSSADAKFFLARHLLAAEDPHLFPEAKILLWQVVEQRHPDWGQAVKSLAYLPNLNAAEVQRCLQLLNALPANDQKRDFAIIDLHLRAEPQRKNELLNAAVAFYGAGSSETMAILARWLSQKNEHARVLELVAPRLRTNKDLFLIGADALAALGQWPALEKLLAEQNLPLDPLLVALYQARTASELKKDRQKNAYWAQVHWLGAEKPDLLWYATQYAARVGERDEAVKGCRRLIEQPRYTRAAYTLLVRLAEQKGDAAEMRRLLIQLARAFPDDPAPANDLAYLDLLQGRNMPAAIDLAKRLTERYPAFLAFRTTLALAHLRMNNRAAARAVYNGLNVQWSKVSPGWQAVYAAVLGQSGDADAARQLARSIPQQRLRAEERVLMTPWL